MDLISYLALQEELEKISAPAQVMNQADAYRFFGSPEQRVAQVNAMAGRLQPPGQRTTVGRPSRLPPPTPRPTVSPTQATQYTSAFAPTLKRPMPQAMPQQVAQGGLRALVNRASSSPLVRAGAGGLAVGGGLALAYGAGKRAAGKKGKEKKSGAFDWSKAREAFKAEAGPAMGTFLGAGIAGGLGINPLAGSALGYGVGSIPEVIHGIRHRKAGGAPAPQTPGVPKQASISDSALSLFVKESGDFGLVGRAARVAGHAAAPAAQAAKRPMPSGHDMLAAIKKMRAGGAPTTIR
jgi:hypothetical protein